MKIKKHTWLAALMVIFLAFGCGGGGGNGAVAVGDGGAGGGDGGTGGGDGGTGGGDGGDGGTDLSALIIGHWECTGTDRDRFQSWSYERVIYEDGTWTSRLMEPGACSYSGPWYLDGTLLYMEATSSNDPVRCPWDYDQGGPADLDSWFFYDDCYELTWSENLSLHTCCLK
jgi:hypothetical protein